MVKALLQLDQVLIPDRRKIQFQPLGTFHRFLGSNCFASLQVTTSMLNPPGTRYQILMLAESESDKEKWVGSLVELHKVLKKSRIQDKSVCSLRSNIDLHAI